jgi:hypothetical protein
MDQDKPRQMAVERFTRDLFDLFYETFEGHKGIYLDKNTSLFETLDTITAAAASLPVSERCASIAAQVEHTRFYIDVMEQVMLGDDPKVDWDEIWRTVEAVTPDEWEASKNRLKASYQRVRSLMDGFGGWEGENQAGGAMATLVHTAFHLGQIRQALCTVKADAI